MEHCIINVHISTLAINFKEVVKAPKSIELNGLGGILSEMVRINALSNLRVVSYLLHSPRGNTLLISAKSPSERQHMLNIIY